MTIASPEKRVWWNEPIERVELIWIAIAFLWGLFMFFFMVAWHFFGGQNLSNETYRVTPGEYEQKVYDFAGQYQVGEEAGVPVVQPPVGGDAYMLARLWEWWPILQLREGESYRIHLSSADWQHGFSLLPTNINIQVHPGYEHVITVTPTEAGEYGIVCNEYCGIGHHQMLGRIIVLASEGGAQP